MSAQQHIIKRQILDLHLKERRNARQIQNQLSLFCHSQMEEIVEEVCSTLVDPESYIQIDHLEINLGQISPTHLEEELKEKIHKKFYESLSEHIRHLHVAQQFLQETRDNLQTSSASSGSHTRDRILSQAAFALELLRHFLKTGTLPWWTKEFPSASPEDTLRGLLTKTPHDVQRLLEELLQDEYARRRLIYQFSDAVLLDIVEMLAPEQLKQIRSMINDLHSLSLRSQFLSLPEAKLRLLVWDAVLTALFRHQKELTERELVQLMIEIQRNHVFSEQSKADQSPLPLPFEGTATRSATSLTRSQTGVWKQPDERISGLTPPSGELTQLEDDAAVTEVYIENAGLVLLWPYLSPFFTHFDLLRENEFVDETSAMRAIHLLQYLATGEDDTAEYVLPLNKLLCGWELSKPVNKDFTASDAEKAESEKLLHIVIAHWSALKNTSILGFRTSFLQRNGALSKKEKSWFVRVERKAYDLLLERLPWSISMIKLSWMKTILYVEW